MVSEVFHSRLTGRCCKPLQLEAGWRSPHRRLDSLREQGFHPLAGNPPCNLVIVQPLADMAGGIGIRVQHTPVKTAKTGPGGDGPVADPSESSFAMCRPGLTHASMEPLRRNASVWSDPERFPLRDPPVGAYNSLNTSAQCCCDSVAKPTPGTIQVRIMHRMNTAPCGSLATTNLPSGIFISGVTCAPPSSLNLANEASRLSTSR